MHCRRTASLARAASALLRHGVRLLAPAGGSPARHGGRLPGGVRPGLSLPGDLSTSGRSAHLAVQAEHQPGRPRPATRGRAPGAALAVAPADGGPGRAGPGLVRIRRPAPGARGPGSDEGDPPRRLRPVRAGRSVRRGGGRRHGPAPLDRAAPPASRPAGVRGAAVRGGPVVTSGMDELPPRLIEAGRGPAAELLRRFTRQAPHAPGENAAWDATLARLGREAGEHRARLLLALVVGAVAGAAALYAALVPH